MHFLKLHGKQAKRFVTLNIICGLLHNIFYIVQAYCLASIVNAIYIQHNSLLFVHKFLFIIIFCILLRTLLVYFKERLSFKSADIVKTSLRKLCLEHIIEQGPKLEKRYRSGETSTIILEQIEATHDFYAYYLPQVGLTVLIPLAILIAIYPFNWLVGCLLLITAPLVPLFMVLIGLGAKAANERNFKALARLSNQFLDLTQGISTLKIFNQIKSKTANLEQSTQIFRQKSMEVLRIGFVSSAIMEFFSTLSIAMLATYLGLSFLQHWHIGYYGQALSLKIGLFILLLAPEFYLPLRQLGSLYHAKQQALAVSQNLQQLLIDPNATSTDWLKQEKASPLKTSNYQSFSILNILDVTVRYEENEYNSLSDINLAIKAGEKIAIIGKSGAGKSTLLNLLLGFITPSKGRITINGINLTAIDFNEWRKQISWLGQEPRLLFGTVETNLQLANPLATELELLEACKIAQLQELILSSSQGLKLKIGEENAGLSGGQAQRLALARMYLKPCSLFILDEPTASLDEENTYFLHQTLLKIMKNKTIIMSTHKKETAQLADRLILLDRGKIIADGKKDDILNHPLLIDW